MDIRPVEQFFDTYLDYRQAIANLILLTQRELVVFDLDLKETGLHAGAGLDALTALLASRSNVRLRMILHDPDHVQGHCPRMLGLLRTYGHIASARQSPESLRGIADSFIVADERHAVIRFHTDYARGKLLIDHEDEVRNWQHRFEDLWELSTQAIPATTLGL